MRVGDKKDSTIVHGQAYMCVLMVDFHNVTLFTSNILMALKFLYSSKNLTFSTQSACYNGYRISTTQ